MFCGIVMAKYCRPNLSPKTNERVGAFFRVIAYLAEIFVFIYIGIALFTEPQVRRPPVFLVSFACSTAASPAMRSLGLTMWGAARVCTFETPQAKNSFWV